MEQQSTRPHLSTSPTSKVAHYHRSPKPGGVGPSHSSPTVLPHATTVPAHLRPTLSPDASLVEGLPSEGRQGSPDISAAVSDMTGTSDVLGVSDEGSRVTNETAEQIIELLLSLIHI